MNTLENNAIANMDNTQDKMKVDDKETKTQDKRRVKEMLANSMKKIHQRLNNQRSMTLRVTLDNDLKVLGPKRWTMT